METLSDLTPIAVFTISFCAVFTALGFMFNILLNPVKKEVSELKEGQKALNQEVSDLNKEVLDLKTGQKNLNKEVLDLKTGQKEMSAKLDLLLSHRA